MLLSVSTAAVLRWRTQPIRLCMLPCPQPYTHSLTTLASFVKILVIEIFSSVLGLFGLIVGLLVSGKASEFGQK